jgi:hypothetical protein
MGFACRELRIHTFRDWKDESEASVISKTGIGRKSCGVASSLRHPIAAIYLGDVKRSVQLPNLTCISGFVKYSIQDLCPRLLAKTAKPLFSSRNPRQTSDRRPRKIAANLNWSSCARKSRRGFPRRLVPLRCVCGATYCVERRSNVAVPASPPGA